MHHINFSRPSPSDKNYLHIGNKKLYRIHVWRREKAVRSYIPVQLVSYMTKYYIVQPCFSGLESDEPVHYVVYLICSKKQQPAETMDVCLYCTGLPLCTETG